MRSKHESAILSTDTCQQILFSDRCQMNITWMRNIKDTCDKPAASNLREKPSVGNQVVTFHTDLHEGMYTHADRWMDRMHITQYVCIHTENHMTTISFKLHGLPNFLSNGALLLQCAGALLDQELSILNCYLHNNVLLIFFSLEMDYHYWIKTFENFLKPVSLLNLQ